MKSFGAYLFTPPVVAEQAKLGVAEKYARVYENRLTGPQYIEPRFTQDEVAELVAPLLAERDSEIEALSQRLCDIGHNPEAAV